MSSLRASLAAIVLCFTAGALGCAGSAGGGGDASTPMGGDGGTTIGDARPIDTPPLGANVVVHLVPRAGVSGMTRVNFAVPFAPGQLSDPNAVRVLVGGA